MDESIRLVVNDDQSEEAPGYEGLLMEALGEMFEDPDFVKGFQKGARGTSCCVSPGDCSHFFAFVRSKHCSKSFFVTSTCNLGRARLQLERDPISRFIYC